MDFSSEFKRLFSSIINKNQNYDIEYLISAENYVLLILKNSDKAICYKKIESKGNDTIWKERTYDDAREALNKLNLDYLQDDDDEDYEENESSSKDGTNNEIDEIDGIQRILFELISFISKF